MGLWSVILPKETINLITNPSFETGIAGQSAQGTNTIAQSAEYAFRGVYSLKCTYQNDTRFFIFAPTPNIDITSGLTYYLHAWILVNTGWDGGNLRLTPLYITSTGTTTYNRIWIAGTNPELTWYYLETKIVCTGSGVVRFQFEMTSTPTAGKFVYIDAMMLEEQDNGATTYCDGDQDGCRWSALPHASSSSRSAQSRSGGQVVDLADYNFNIRQFDGIGLPPLDHRMLDQPLVDGSLYQGSKVLPRYFLLTGAVFSTESEVDFHSQRKNIINAILPDAVKGSQPILFRYSGANEDKDLEIPAYYDRGLDYSSDLPKAEKIALRLLAPDPYFYELANIAHQLTERQLLLVKYVWGKVDNEWNALGPISAATDPGTGIAVYAIAQDASKNIYVGGDFFNWNGTANSDFIAKWNGSAWSSLGTGMNGNVKALAFTPAGILLAGGGFTTAGGLGANYMAKWDGASWVAFSAPGFNARVNDIVVGPDGTVYACGNFTTVDGGAANYIAKHDGSSWSALGTGLNGEALKMAIAPDGSLYVVGVFTTAGGTTVNRVAKWDGTTWSALGSGANAGINGIAIDKKGIVYVGGGFTTIGGVSVTRVAYWNGSAWFAMGDGVNNTVRGLTVDHNTGLVWANGQFTTAGGIATAGIAIWNGSSWARPDVYIPGSNTFWKVFINTWGDIYVGGQGAGTFEFSEVNTITNQGTAKAYPRIFIGRSGGAGATIQYLKNETTGKTIWLNYALLDGEEIVLDFRPRHRGIISNFFGNVHGRAVLRGSDFADFCFLKGENNISVLVTEDTGPTITCYAIYNPAYASVDGIAP